jgi:cell fate (sporulation/competence/biofilm development) regulator YlbF (YheA/YmcA/DUF963 family)
MERELPETETKETLELRNITSKESEVVELMERKKSMSDYIKGLNYIINNNINNKIHLIINK